MALRIPSSFSKSKSSRRFSRVNPELLADLLFPRFFLGILAGKFPCFHVFKITGGLFTAIDDVEFLMIAVKEEINTGQYEQQGEHKTILESVSYQPTEESTNVNCSEDFGS